MALYFMLIYLIPVFILTDFIKQKYDMLSRLIGEENLGASLKEMLMMVFIWPLWPIIFWLAYRFRDKNDD